MDLFVPQQVFLPLKRFVAANKGTVMLLDCTCHCMGQSFHVVNQRGGWSGSWKEVGAGGFKIGVLDAPQQDKYELPKKGLHFD